MLINVVWGKSQYAVNSWWGIYRVMCAVVYLHLLRRAFPTGLFSSELEGTVVKSSKFIIIRLMSSTSLRIGAITSEHRNFEPEKKRIVNQMTLMGGGRAPFNPSVPNIIINRLDRNRDKTTAFESIKTPSRRLYINTQRWWCCILAAKHLPDGHDIATTIRFAYVCTVVLSSLNYANNCPCT